MTISVNTTWEIVDNDFADVACAKCANVFLREHGVSNHTVGENYSNEQTGVYAQEDVFGQHSGEGHTCSGCGILLG